jgi:glycosyl transferase, family 25
MKNYVISLSSAQQRRAHIQSEFSRRAVEFEFFDAVAPATVEATARVLGLDSTRTQLHQREVACLLSHVALWKKAVEEQLDYMAIFEDDIHLGEHAGYFLASSSWIPSQCQIVKLEAFYKRIVVLTEQPTISLPHKRRLMVLGSAHMGGGGYILSNRAASELIAFLAERSELSPIDHVVFGNYPQETGNWIHQMVPALCIQDMNLAKDGTRFPSHLKDVRSVRRGENKEKERLGLAGKAKREISRILIQIERAMRELVQMFQGRRTMRIRFK